MPHPSDQIKLVIASNAAEVARLHERKQFIWKISLRLASFCLLLAFSGLVRPAEPTVPSWSVGLWQFGDRTVWVKIEADGAAFQCRIAPGGTVFKAEGHFSAPQSIRWKAMWETDNITRQGDQLVLTGKWGSFSYHRADGGMSPRCFGPHVPNFQ